MWPLFACTAEAAAFQGLDWSARRASLWRLVPPDRTFPRRCPCSPPRIQLTLVVGPAAAGLLIAHAGFRLVYGLDVASFAVALARCCCCRALPPDRGGQPASFASLIGGIRYVRSQPAAGRGIPHRPGGDGVRPAAGAVPGAGHHLYGGGAATVGYLNAAPGVGALIGSLLTGRVGRVQRGRAGRWRSASWCGGWPSPAFGLVPWLPAALALLAAAGAADVISAVFRMMIVQQVTPDGMQGRVNSLIYAGIQGGPRLGDAEAGGAAALGGPQFAAWSGGLLSVVTAVATCWLLPGMWRYDSRRTGPGRAAARRRGRRGAG